MQNQNSGGRRPVDELMSSTIENIKNMLSVQTIVGEAIDMGEGCRAYPVIKITVGLVSGGGEYSAKKISKHISNLPFAGGSGAGFTAEPVGFVINNHGNVTFSTVKNKNVTGEILKKLSDALTKYVDKILKIKEEEVKND